MHEQSALSLVNNIKRIHKEALDGYLPVHYLNKPDCWGEDRFQSVNRDEVHANENNLAIQQDFIKTFLKKQLVLHFPLRF